MDTLATSARLTSKSGQPDLFELSTETGQDQYPLCHRSDRCLTWKKLPTEGPDWTQYLL
jgi:hypothetical protein